MDAWLLQPDLGEGDLAKEACLLVSLHLGVDFSTEGAPGQPPLTHTWLLLGNIGHIFAHCGLVVEIQLHLAAKL